MAEQYPPPGEEIIIATAPGTAYVGGDGRTAVSYENATSGVGAYLIPSEDAFGLADNATYTKVEDLIGSQFNDWLWGDGKGNDLYGLGGMDALYGFASSTNVTTRMFGGSGMDTLLGGLGIDIMDGGEDEDTISYFLSPTGLTISLANPSINTGWATGDVYISIQDVIGSNFDDIIYGSNEGLLNQLQGQDGNDTIYGGSGYNVLIGGAGADKLYGGNVGMNLVDYETATSGLTASLENPGLNTGDAAGDSYHNLFNADLAGSPFNDILYGDSQNNHLIGDPTPADYGGKFGNDTLYGGGGDDIIEGNLGADSINGGEGFDYAAYSTSATAVYVSLLNPSQNTGEAAGDTYTSIEGVFGSNFADTLIGDGAANTLFGEAGNDQIYGGGGDDLLVGGQGADQLDGGAGFNYISFGGVGAGITVSLANTSLNTGEAAGDTYINIQGILGSGYGDTLYGDTGVNVLQGLGGNDVIYGGGGADLLTGGDGDDILIAGPGASRLFGEGGADTFRFLSATDSISTPQIAPTEIHDFQTGVDKIDISAIQPQSFQIVQENGFYTLTATTAAGTFAVRSTNAFSASDVITQVAGQTLLGTSGYDKLVGGAGADILFGAGAGDNLTGGGGPDLFVYKSVSDSTQSDYDIITDFQAGVDRIDLIGVAPTYISMVHGGGATYLFPTGGVQIAAIGDVRGSDVVTGVATNFYIVGDNSGQTLVGGAYSDSVVGGAGNDRVIGGTGGDALYGGAGVNTFAFFSVADSNNQNLDLIHDFKTGVDKVDLSTMNVSNVSIIRYNGGAFINGGTAGGAFQIGSIQALNGSDILGLTNGVYLVGENVGQTLVGSALDDTIVGGSGNDRIQGGAWGDALFGGAGADTFVYTGAPDSNALAGQMDIIHDFETGVDKLDLTALNPSNVSVVHYNGGTFVFGASDTGSFQIASTRDINASDIVGLKSGAYIVGDSDPHTLRGGAFAETIAGGSAAETIIGGGGSDALFGGGGADVFKYLAASDSAPGAADLIHDFQTGVDKIDLSALHTSSIDKYSLISDGKASYIFVQLAGNTGNDVQILINTPGVQASDIIW